MKFQTKRIFNILLIALIIIYTISYIGIEILIHSENMGTYYLYRFISSTKFARVTKNMNIQNFNGGRVYSKNKLGNSYSKLIDDSIQKGSNDVKRIFGQTGAYPIRIVVFSTTEEYNNAINGMIGGVASYDTYASYFTLDQLTSYSLIHEYTHFRTESFCKDKKINYLTIPAWFNEGIAEYISFPYRRYKSLSLQKLKNFRELDKETDFEKARQEGYDVYFQSYLAVKKIIDLKGEKSIQNILLDLNNMNFYSAFDKNMGLSIEEFQKLLK